MLTKEQEKRVIAAMIETQRCLDREAQYSEAVRDHKLVAFCETHLARLIEMLSDTSEAE